MAGSAAVGRAYCLAQIVHSLDFRGYGPGYLNSLKNSVGVPEERDRGPASVVKPNNVSSVVNSCHVRGICGTTGSGHEDRCITSIGSREEQALVAAQNNGSISADRLTRGKGQTGWKRQ